MKPPCGGGSSQRMEFAVGFAACRAPFPLRRHGEPGVLFPGIGIANDIEFCMKHIQHIEMYIITTTEWQKIAVLFYQLKPLKSYQGSEMIQSGGILLVPAIENAAMILLNCLLLHRIHHFQKGLGDMMCPEFLLHSRVQFQCLAI